MRDYELTMVIDPDLKEADQIKLIAKVEKLITDAKGKSLKPVSWGKKELAYPIKKKSFGSYFFLALSLSPEELTNIDKKIRLEEEIIRYLLIGVEKPKPTQEKPLDKARDKGGKRGAKVTK